MWPEMRSAHNARKEMNILDTHITVAIDGPSGAGKSTIARAAARRFGLIYVDTGAIYRTVGLACERAGADCSDTAAVQVLLAANHCLATGLVLPGLGYCELGVLAPIVWGLLLVGLAESARVADGADGVVCGSAFLGMLGLMGAMTILGWFPLGVLPLSLIHI